MMLSRYWFLRQLSILLELKESSCRDKDWSLKSFLVISVSGDVLRHRNIDTLTQNKSETEPWRRILTLITLTRAMKRSSNRSERVGTRWWWPILGKWRIRGGRKLMRAGNVWYWWLIYFFCLSFRDNFFNGEDSSNSYSQYEYLCSKKYKNLFRSLILLNCYI